MAKQDRPTKGIWCHGGWQVLQVLAATDDWVDSKTACKLAAENLPDIVWERKSRPKKAPWLIIHEWLWRSLGLGIEMPLEFINRNGKMIRITAAGKAFVESKKWQDYEPVILEWNHRRSALYYLRRLSNQGVREVTQLAVNELAQREPV